MSECTLSTHRIAVETDSTRLSDSTAALFLCRNMKHCCHGSQHAEVVHGESPMILFPDSAHARQKRRFTLLRVPAPDLRTGSW